MKNEKKSFSSFYQENKTKISSFHNKNGKEFFLNKRMVEKARKATEIKFQRIRQREKKSPFNINKKRTKKKAKEKV